MKTKYNFSRYRMVKLLAMKLAVQERLMLNVEV